MSDNGHAQKTNKVTYYLQIADENPAKKFRKKSIF